MTLTFTDEKCIRDDSGTWLCLKVTDPAAARRFCMEQTKQIAFDAEIKEHREKRSIDANRYLWHLLGELAAVLRTTKEELYLHYVREYGIFRDWALPPEQAKTFDKVWSSQGTGWPTETVDYTPDGCNLVVRAYYGTSQYNTKQMSRIIDHVVEDCKENDIETLPPEKLDLLKREWTREV